jgi:DNA-binding transcriptional regulator YhcF (GntR family)
MSGNGRPASARIAAELRRRITSGELAPGARVPSTRAIVQRYGVAMATATKVLAALQHEGLIRTVPGVGSVVAGSPPAERPARRRSSSPEGALGVPAIVAAGIAVADAEGLAALSMRRVAAELGARALWTTFRRHPWLPSAMSLTRPQLLPGALDYAEWVLGILTRGGWDPLTTFTTYLTVFVFVRGLAMNLEMEAEAEAVTGLTDDEWIGTQEPALEALVADGRHPVFASVLDGMDFDMDLDALFEFGLQRLLAGFAAVQRG